MKSRMIMIYGAGAIGRGFLAPLFNRMGFEIIFVDKDEQLINVMKRRHEYKTAFINKNNYEFVNVKYKHALLLGEEDEYIDKVEAVFSCVGPNNIKEFAYKLRNAKSVISFENESESADKIKIFSGNPNCFFGIPDVITSNYCPPSLKKIDSLCLISEKGKLAIENGNFIFSKEICVCSKKEIEKYWNCKFYLHNAPHAAAAFLGKKYGLRYLHESMRIVEIKKVVESLMISIKEAMKIKHMADEAFIEFYANKELGRFKDELLFDPISRVGRDPLRKLRGHERLLKVARFIEESGGDSKEICLVIKVALQDAINNYYEETRKIVGDNVSQEEILKKVSGLNENDILFQKIIGREIRIPLAKKMIRYKIVN